MLLEKLAGVAIIGVAVAVLALVSIFDPPTLVQILIALVGSFVCLIGIVIVFSEGRIWTKESVKASAKVGQTAKVSAS